LRRFELFFNPDHLSEIWIGNTIHYLLNAIACTTGMRKGEIQALRWSAIDDTSIHVAASWDRKYGDVQPKHNSVRYVPLRPAIHDLLNDLRKAENDAEYVFQNSSGTKPIDHKLIDKYLYRALSSIGINAEERLSRNITFHSWRHAFDTYTRPHVSDADLRKVIGHRTPAMTDHYDHATPEMLERIMEAVRFFPE
jgi:integrase